MSVLTQHGRLFFDPLPTGAADEDAFLDAMTAALVKSGARDVRRGPREVVFGGSGWANALWSTVGYVDSGRVWIADQHGDPVLHYELHFHRIARWLLGTAIVLSCLATVETRMPVALPGLCLLAALFFVPVASTARSGWRRALHRAAAHASFRLTV